MKISVVIPHITTKPEHLIMLRECMDTLVKFNKDMHEVIIVDDASAENYKQELQGECQRRGFTYLFNSVNSGFPPTANKGIRAATGDIVVVVNNDIVFTQEVMSHFKRSFEMNERVGLVGALLFYPAGNIQHGGIARIGPFAHTHRGWHKRFENAPEVHRTEYLIAVTGALFGMRKKMMDEIGPFQDKYFLAFDDVEICYRAWKADWRVLYNPNIRAIHKEGATRGKTHHEKVTKHRVWFQKELETHQKFLQDMKNYDEGVLEEKVAMANADLLGLLGHGVTPETDVMIFESDKVEFVNGGAKDVGAKKIIIKRDGALGDVILATPIVRRMKQLNPECEIIVCTRFPEVFNNNVHVSKTVKMTHGMSYEKLIDLDFVYEKNPKVHVVEAYAKEAFGNVDVDFRPELFSTASDYNSMIQKLPGVDFSKDRIAVLHMGHAWPSRTWPKHRWLEVARGLSNSDFKVIVVGKGQDFRSDLYKNVINMVDQFTIHELHQLLTNSHVFVGIDSGLLHIAQCTDVPIVSMFTVANPKYRIVRRSSRTMALLPKVDCRFCLHEETPPVTNYVCKFGTNHCQNTISSMDVIAKVRECARS